MKNWLVLVLVLTVLAAGIWHVWFKGDPSIRQVSTGGIEKSLQLDSRDIALSNHPDPRNSTKQLSARQPEARFQQAGNSSLAETAHDPIPKERERLSRSNSVSANTGTASDSPDVEQGQDRVIGGMVIDEDGLPLSGIEIQARRIDPADSTPPLLDKSEQGMLSVYSDLDGIFLFWDLDDGTYHLRIAPTEGVAPAQTTVRAGSIDIKLMVRLLWQIKVYGVVRSDDGKPLQNVQVTAGRETRATSTGPKGEFELDLNLQGVKQTQFVHFRRDGYRDQKMAINPAELNYQVTKLQLDVSMEPLASPTTVTGSLRDTEGRPVPGEILTMASSMLRTSYQAQSDIKGNFTFKEVEPGDDYRLQIRPGPSYQNKDINSLEVSSSGLNLDIVLELVEEGELSGWMVDLNANPIPGFALNLHSKVVAGQPVRVVGDQRGFFKVQDFPVGNAVFSTNSYPMFSVQGIRVSPEHGEPIIVILDTGSHVLKGRVINNMGEPVAAASVILTWTFSENGVQSSSSSRKTASGQNGNFVFTGLGPGLHRLQVSEAQYSKAAVKKIEIGQHSGNIDVVLDNDR